MRREQIDALLEELRDPALARKFLMDAGLIDAAMASSPLRTAARMPGRPKNSLGPLVLFHDPPIQLAAAR